MFQNYLRVQGQMAQRINVVLNSIPTGCRDLAEFAFFCGVGFTCGSLGLIWSQTGITMFETKKIFYVVAGTYTRHLSYRLNDSR